MLDPYGLHLNWEVIKAAGESGAVDMFVNFPVMDMNRNALWRNPDKVGPNAIRRMTDFWGDESWRKAAYRKTKGLFEEIDEKESNETIARAFGARLKGKAGFRYVLEPLPMRNSLGVVVYYLFFAAQKTVAHDIVKQIFAKHAQRATR